jgi:hypothetical protein
VITRRLLPLHKSFFQPLLQAYENPASHDDVARITESRSAVDLVTFATSQTAVIVKVVPHFPSGGRSEGDGGLPDKLASV